MFRFPLCLLLSYNLCALVLSHGMLGPSDFVFKKMEHCDPELHEVYFWINKRAINRTVSVLDIILSSPYPIDDQTIELELKGSMKKEGGYKSGAFYHRDKACSSLQKMLGDMFTKILHEVGSEDCPLPAGNYNATDFYFDNNEFTVPQLYGEYKMEALIHKEGEVRSCFMCYYDFLPKES